MVEISGAFPIPAMLRRQMERGMSDRFVQARRLDLGPVAVEDLEQALKESGTQLLEPYLSFTLYAPREYLSRAYHDAPKYCAS